MYFMDSDEAEQAMFEDYSDSELDAWVPELNSDSSQEPFYLDSEEHDSSEGEPDPEVRSSLQNWNQEMALSFLEQPNLNSTEMNTWSGQSNFQHAISSNNMNIVQSFIDHGADINGCDFFSRTPLLHAAWNNNIEGVCMLLSYGVDVRMSTSFGETPLSIAYKQNYGEIIKYLLSHYYEFANINLTDIAFDYRHQMRFECEDVVLLAIAMHNGYIEPFQIILSRIDITDLSWRPSNDRFVQKYLCNSMFAPSNQLDCVYSMLEITDLRYLLGGSKFFLHQAFLNPKFDQNRRMDLLFMVLMTGVAISFKDIHRIYQICGFNKELEALIYAANFDWTPEPYNSVLFHFILSFHVDCDTQNVYDYYNKDLERDIRTKAVIPWLKYFSLPSDFKYELTNTKACSSEEEKNEFLVSLREVPEFPSLLELARLAVQKYIKQTIQLKPYLFHDAVKNLNLPRQLQDVILFKTPIY